MEQLTDDGSVYENVSDASSDYDSNYEDECDTSFYDQPPLEFNAAWFIEGALLNVEEAEDPQEPRIFLEAAEDPQGA